MSDNEKNIEIVSGDGSNLDISPVYEHLNAGKPKGTENKPKNIVIPKEKNSKSEDKNDVTNSKVNENTNNDSTDTSSNDSNDDLNDS